MISRHWNRGPEWFDNQDRDLQLRLLADFQLSNESGEQRSKRESRYKGEKFRAAVMRARSEGCKVSDTEKAEAL